MSWWYGKEYESVEQKRRKAEKRIAALRKKQPDIKPVCIEGRALANTFWGKAWCRQMDRMADYENRLPRGRSYARCGAVCHLDIGQGSVSALVSGSSLYTVSVTIKPLGDERWQRICQACRGNIATMLDLLRGKLSKEIMEVVCHPETGIFPLSGEISYSCSCPDSALLCKHVAAVFYGVGNRLDQAPELLFLLRHVDPADLLGQEPSMPEVQGDSALHDTDLGALFGIDMLGRDPAGTPPPPTPEAGVTPPAKGRAAPEAGVTPPAKGRAAPEAGVTPPAKGRAAPEAGVTPPAKGRAAPEAGVTPPAKGRAAPKKPPLAAKTKKKAAGKAAGNAPSHPAPPAGKTARKSGSPALPVLDFERLTGAEVAAFRIAAGLSLYQFASRLDLVEATVRRWESEPGLLVLRSASRKRLLALYKKYAR